jgi:hypothetical protein
MYKLRILRKYSEYTFAQALSYIEYMLKLASTKSHVTVSELVEVKDKILSILMEYVFIIPEQKLDSINLTEKLHVLDTILCTDIIGSKARVVDTYPIANDKRLTSHSIY